MKWNFGKKLGDFAFRPLELDRKITIECGSVRSGKTWSLQPKILRASSSRCKIGGRKIVFGASKETIYRDVLCDLIDVIGTRNFSRNKQTGDFTVCGTPWQCICAKDERSEMFLRGATIGVAIGNELTVLPQSFFQMLLSRLSPPGARLYGTTNPDNPFHWLKTDVIDNDQMLAAGDLEYIHTTMDDNPNLTREFIQQTKRQFTGIFYRRFVNGEWVAGEGGIYAGAFTEDLLYDDVTRPIGLLGQGGYVDRWIPGDYGTANATCFYDVIDDGQTYWIDDEYYWDSRVEQVQKTDKQYIDDLEEFKRKQSGRERAQVVIDPSAASLKAEMTQRAIWHCDGRNDVLDGIRVLASLFAQKKIRIHRRCKHLIKQLESYVWDDKACKRGEEKPVKSNDHGPDAIRIWAYEKVPAWRIAA